MAKIYASRKGCPFLHQIPWISWLRATTTELISFDANQRKSQPFNKKPKSHSPGNFNKSELVHATTTQVKCLACSGQKHSIPYCQTFKEKSLSEKRAFLYQKGLCLELPERKTYGKAMSFTTFMSQMWQETSHSVTYWWS